MSNSKWTRFLSCSLGLDGGSLQILEDGMAFHRQQHELNEGLRDIGYGQGFFVQRESEILQTILHCNQALVLFEFVSFTNI